MLAFLYKWFNRLYSRIVCNLKKKFKRHLDLLLRRIEKLVITVATFFHWVYFPENANSKSLFLIDSPYSFTESYNAIHICVPNDWKYHCTI